MVWLRNSVRHSPRVWELEESAEQSLSRGERLFKICYREIRMVLIPEELSKYLLRDQRAACRVCLGFSSATVVPVEGSPSLNINPQLLLWAAKGNLWPSGGLQTLITGENVFETLPLIELLWESGKSCEVVFLKTFRNLMVQPRIFSDCLSSIPRWNVPAWFSSHRFLPFVRLFVRTTWSRNVWSLCVELCNNKLLAMSFLSIQTQSW